MATTCVDTSTSLTLRINVFAGPVSIAEILEGVVKVFQIFPKDPLGRPKILCLIASRSMLDTTG